MTEAVHLPRRLGGWLLASSGSGVDSGDAARSTGVSSANRLESPGRVTGGNGRSKASRRMWVVGAIAIVAVLCAVAGGYAVARDLNHVAGNSNSRVLIAAPSYQWLPNGQFNEVAFVTATNVSLAGVFSNTHGLVVYIMTPLELLNLTKTGTPSEYTWTSGSIPSLVHYSLSVGVVPGSWDLVFFNPSDVIPSGVDFWSSVTETPS